jgi:hypothetical protein
MDEPVHGHVFAPHALTEMVRRGISGDVVAKVIAAPEQCVVVRPGRQVLQSRVRVDDKTYLVRFLLM